MREPMFSGWSAWHARDRLVQIGQPGIYVIAVEGRDITDEPFSWLASVVYVGMTNAVAGIRGRLRQFDRTISGKRIQHGGADRFRFRFQNYEELMGRLFVAIAPYPCDPTSNLPQDLRIMGDITNCEYECLARFVELHGRLPDFNDKKLSPKFSLIQRQRNADAANADS